MVHKFLDWLNGIKTDQTLLWVIVPIVITSVLGKFGVSLKFLWKGIVWLFKYPWIKNSYIWLTKPIKKRIEKRKYYKLIKRIERGEVEVTDEFLFGKSPEKNPELKTVYLLMKVRFIKKPKLYEMGEKIDKDAIKNIIEKAKYTQSPFKIERPSFLDNDFFKK